MDRARYDKSGRRRKMPRIERCCRGLMTIAEVGIVLLSSAFASDLGRADGVDCPECADGVDSMEVPVMLSPKVLFY